MRVLPLAILALAATAFGCTPARMHAPANSASAMSFLLPAPELGFHLTAEQRAALNPSIPPDTFERLLQWVKPVVRPKFLGVPFCSIDEKIALGEIQWQVMHPEVEQLLGQINAAIRAANSTQADR